MSSRSTRAPFAGIAQPGHDDLQRRRLGFKVRAALVGDGEEFLRAIAARLLDQALLFEHGERRIDHAGARYIETARQLLDRPDEFVAVARLVGDQLEQDQAKLVGIEDPAAPAAPALVGSAPVAAPEPVATAGAEMVPGMVLVPAVAVTATMRMMRKVH